MTFTNSNKQKRKSRTQPPAKVGLPPGSLVHVGEIKTERPQISMLALGMASIFWRKNWLRA